MVIYNEIYGCDLYKELWSGGLDTYNNLVEKGITDDAILQMLEEFFCGDEFVDIGRINDFLWFNSDTVFDYFGINDNEDNEDNEGNEGNEDNEDNEDECI